MHDVLDVLKLMQTDGSFAGDNWGEIDTRFSYCTYISLVFIMKLYRCGILSVSFGKTGRS